MTERIPGFFEGTGMPDSGWWEALWPDPLRVLTDVGVSHGMRVVDLCCGDGWFTFPLTRIARSVTAIDIDAKMIEAAKVRFAGRGGAPNCSFAVADAYEISRFVRESVEHVFMANAFHGVPDKPRLAEAIRGVIKPGGVFAAINWRARPLEQTKVLGEPRRPAAELRMTVEQTIAESERGGLRFLNQVEVSPYHYGVMFERTR